MTKRTCFECGASIIAPQRRKFCSDLCGWRTKDRRKRDSGYYQIESVRKRRNKQARQKYQEAVLKGNSPSLRKRKTSESDWATECKHCEGPIDVPSARRKYCSKKCVSEAKNIRKREYRKSWSDYELSLQYSTHKRRAISYGVLYERFDRYEIFERDNWVCGICGNRVEQQFEHPHPMSASLDHVVPMSKGGHHSPDNTQCSHLDCNLRKGVDHDTEGRIDRFA